AGHPLRPAAVLAARGAGARAGRRCARRVGAGAGDAGRQARRGLRSTRGREAAAGWRKVMLTLPVFEYVRPSSVDDVLRELAEFPGECVLRAGGRDAAPNLKHGLHEPRRVVSLAGVAELKTVREDAAGLHLGALVTLSALTRLPALLRDYAATARA